MKYQALALGAIVAILVAMAASAHKPADEFVGPPDPDKLAAMVAQSKPVKRQWYGRNINKSACIESDSPADKIRDIQSFGQYARTHDLAGGAVEVEHDLPGGRSEVWTFFPSMAACEATLPRNGAVNSRYE
ncbi:hypothetical protein ACFIQG_21840 [Comamonas odontotermitis]|uniref:hypothetical protein n=1 Tax=Comamonas odontotermitis TaxID=379895 RepID=UPI00367299A0